ncbi:MAG: prolyl oligopeptidase family serine peptidase [Planctomycetota bacterium]|nr:prolyl oligopeptidase family serine peptidase [Planctomycetota bacterium]
MSPMRRVDPLSAGRALLAALALACCARAARGAEEPKPLEFLLAADGSLTAWYVAPPAAGELAQAAAVPPSLDGANHAGAFPETWARHVSASRFVSFRDRLNQARRGLVWAATRVHSPEGGKRRLFLSTYCGSKVFLDGKLLLDKPEPRAAQADEKQLEFELPAGVSTFAVATEIRYGYCGFQLALTKGESDVPHALDRVLLRDSAAPPSLAAVLPEVFVFEPQRWLVPEGRALEVVVGVEAGWPAGLGELTPKLRGPEGFEVDDKHLVPRPIDQLAKAPWRAAIKLPEKHQAAIDLTLELSDGKTILAKRTLRLYGIGGLLDRAKDLETRLAAKQAETGKSFPYAELALEKVQIWFGRFTRGEIRDVNSQKELGVECFGLLDDAERCLKLEAEGKDPAAGRTGYFERCYVSKIDESPQPYFALVPSAAKDELGKQEPLKRYPLVLFLHGYVPDYHKHRWWLELPEFNATFERNGCFLAIPFGRSNADFVGPGEVDVLDVMEEMQRAYPIDPDRVYLYGYSMGGMGVYTLGAHHPDLWAAGIVIAGRADSPLLMGTRGMETLHAFKQWLVRADHPIDLCENFVNIPLRIYHGNQDQFIHPEAAQRITKRLKEIGCDAELTLQDGDHYFGFDLMYEDAMVKWLLEHKRERAPKRNRLKNFSLRYGNCRGLRIAHLTGDLAPFEVEWATAEQAPGAERTMALSKLDGPIGQMGWDANRYLGLGHPKEQREGWTYYTRNVQNEDALPFEHGYYRDGWKGFSPAQDWNPAWKSPVRCGPIKEATYAPFVVAFGTLAEGPRSEELRKAAAQFAQEWYAFAKGRAILKPDREVTADEKKNKNLILFGQEDENSILAECAAVGKLPFTLKGGVIVAGERNLKLEGKGLMFIYPNPLKDASPASSIVVVAGEHYGQYLPENHKWDLLPDFLVYTPERSDDGTNANKPILAGFFDGKWQWNPKTTWWFEENLVAPKKEEEK